MWLKGLIIISCCILGSSALKCYICNSVDNSTGCGHGKEVSRDFLQECGEPPVQGQKYDMCRKIVTMIEFNVNNNTANERITRKCGYMTSKYDEECYYRGGFGGRQRVCSCKKDECNSASGLSIGFATILSTTFVWLAKFM